MRTRSLAAGGALLLTASLSACGGGGSGAPADASKEDFCDAYTSIFDELFANADPEATEEEISAAAIRSLKDWAETLEETGTPEDIPDDAREGFELTLEAVNDLDEDTDINDLDALEGDFSGDEKEAGEAFEKWATEECPFDVPGLDLPSDVPTE